MANLSSHLIETNLRELFAILLMVGFPFALAFVFQSIAIPKGYSGIRNELLSPKDQKTFNMWKYTAYGLVKSDDSHG
jgi:hypothetical protein